ncbi:PMEI domain-containing protein [Abeliophyllum distichum]|uniref:PMEI domain-containing protein n=1 Tax=Abeliophyllum distichum TaxID=126358 RepID=A0ABD1NS57_9LAMI
MFDNVKADLIGDICSEAHNHVSCNQVLRSVPHSAKADLRDLGQIAIDKATAMAKTTLILVKELGKGQVSSICAEVFGDVIHNLNECPGLLHSSNRLSPNDLSAEASSAMYELVACDDKYEGNEPANVKQAIQTTYDTLSIILAIAARL